MTAGGAGLEREQVSVGDAPLRAVRCADGQVARPLASDLWIRKRRGLQRLADELCSWSDGKRSPLLWSLPAAARPSTTTELVEHTWRLARGKPVREVDWIQRCEAWLASTGGRSLSASLAVECLAWRHALPRLADVLNEGLWLQLVERLAEVAAAAARLRALSHPLEHQLAAAELTLFLSRMIADAQQRRLASDAAHDALRCGLQELLDEQGLPGARHLALQRPLLACWLRCARLVRRSSGFSGSELQQRLTLATREALRFTHCDGSQAFCEGDERTEAHQLLDAAVDLCEDAELTAMRQLAWPGHAKSRKLRSASSGKRRARRWPAAAYHGSTQQVAMLRSDWSRASERLAVTYDAGRVRIELAAGGRMLLQGEWSLTARIDDLPASVRGAWREVCWFTDDDVDYLEIEAELSDDLLIQRQMLLARNDGFVLLADAVLGDLPGRLHYRSQLPLARGVTVRDTEATREGWLDGDRTRALVLPLALSEWRGDPAGGGLSAADGSLVLEQSVVGRSLYAPLWIDLDRKRHGKSRTWRQLTVAEQRQIVGRDIAAGYRVQMGKRQWLIYRSLTPAANRTLLGVNLSSEFLTARFGRDGQPRTLVEVEQ